MSLPYLVLPAATYEQLADLLVQAGLDVSPRPPAQITPEAQRELFGHLLEDMEPTVGGKSTKRYCIRFNNGSAAITCYFSPELESYVLYVLPDPSAKANFKSSGIVEEIERVLAMHDATRP